MRVIFSTSGDSVEVPSDHSILTTSIPLSEAVKDEAAEFVIPKHSVLTSTQFKQYLSLDGVYQRHKESFEMKFPVHPDEDRCMTAREKNNINDHVRNSLFRRLRTDTSHAVIAMKVSLHMADETCVEKCLDTLCYISRNFVYVLCMEPYQSGFGFYLVSLIIREFQDYEPVIKDVFPRLSVEYVCYLVTNPFNEKTEETPDRTPLLAQGAYFMFEDPPRFENGTLLGMGCAKLLRDCLKNAARTNKLREHDALYVSIMDCYEIEDLTFDQVCKLVEIENQENSYSYLAGVLHPTECLEEFESMISRSMPNFNDSPWTDKYPYVFKLRCTSEGIDGMLGSNRLRKVLHEVFPSISEALGPVEGNVAVWKAAILKEMRDYFIANGRPDIAEKYYS